MRFVIVQVQGGNKMYKYPRYINIDYSEYESDNVTETKYGLPKDIIFCKECVISNQRPNSCQEFLHKKDSKKETIHFGEDGVCDGCRANWDKQYHINWTEREKELFLSTNRWQNFHHTLISCHLIHFSSLSTSLHA